MDISDVSYCKIHPSIGVARIANNEDYFEFFDALSRNFSPASDYMSVGGPSDPEPGKLRLKRQAVQFKIFAYNSNNDLIGELHEKFPDLQAHWSTKVGNRKLFNYTSKRGSGVLNPVTAQATASQPNQFANLDGVSPWHSSTTVNLGSISGTGLFIPPKGGVTRERPESTIDRYPADQGGSLQCMDTTCDGEISATVYDESGARIELPVIPSWVVVAPPQHCLTLNPGVAEAMADNFGSFQPNNNNQNKDWIKSTKSLIGISGDIHDPTGLDVPMMETMNADYNPGMEVNIGNDPSRVENGVNPKDFFYPRGTAHIGENEIRIQPEDERANATVPGQITSGLCSTWQGDMTACLNYWTAENPNRAYGTNDNPEIVIYREGNPNATMNTPEEINANMDFRGIVDFKPEGNDIRLDLVYDPNRSNGIA